MDSRGNAKQHSNSYSFKNTEQITLHKYQQKRKHISIKYRQLGTTLQPVSGPPHSRQCERNDSYRQKR